MLTRTSRAASRSVAATAELAAVADLMTQSEAPISDAPQYSPPAAVAFALVLSPKPPKEKEKSSR